MIQSPLRYFSVVSVHARYVWIGFAALVGLGCWQLHLSPDDPTGPLAAILLWQMFAVSTGFMSSARMGYYDPILVGGTPRWRIAVAHWCTSAGPGAMAWLVLALFAATLSQPPTLEPLRPSNLMAWLVVSACGWTLGLMLPRMGSGVVWVTAILLAGTTRVGLVHVRMLVTHTELPGVAEAIAAGLTFVGCPFLLLGSPPASENLWVRGSCALAAILTLAAGIHYVNRSEYPLAVQP